MTTLLKHLTALAAAATMMLAVSAPARAQLGDLKFGSYKVTSVVPTSFTSLAVTGHAALESVSSLFALVRNPTIDPAAYTIDVKADIRIRGRKYPVEKKGIPLSRILKR